MTGDKITGQLRKVVSKATKDIRMFRDLYGDKVSIKNLEDFQKLPITNRIDYARLQDVSDSVKDPWEMVEIVAPWRWESSEFPIPLLYSNQDILALEERTRYLLSQMSLREGHTITLLVEVAHIYTASDLAENLIYLGFPCQIILLENEPESTIRKRLSEAHAISLFLFSDRDINSEAFPSNVRHVASFNIRQKPKGPFQHLDVFHLDEIPLVAVNRGDGLYRCCDGHFFFEQSNEGTLLITTLRQNYAQFIRYDTGLAASIDGNSFRLEYK